MNLGNILASIGNSERRLLQAARSAIIFVRSAYSTLAGQDQHLRTVSMVREAFPTVAQWILHAVVAAVYGWIKEHEPAQLAATTSFISLDTPDPAPDQPPPPEALFARSPFSVHPLRPVEPPPEPGLGESLPPPHDPGTAPPPPLRPQAPRTAPSPE